MEFSETVAAELFENAADAILCVDALGKIVNSNPQAQRLFGYSHTEFIGQDLNEIVPPRFREKHPLAFETFLQTHSHRDFLGREARCIGIARDGREIPLDIRIGPFHQAEGMLLAHIRDLSESHRTQQDLEKSETRFRSTLDNSLEGCQLIGFDWTYLYLNDVAATQGRRTQAELLGRTMMECYPGIENTPLFDHLRRCMEQREPQRLENEFIFPDGSKGWFELSIQPVPEGVFILSLDVSERKRAQEQLEHQILRLKSLHTIDRAILNTTDMRIALNTVLQETRDRLGVDAGLISLLNLHNLMLEPTATMGLNRASNQRLYVRVGEGVPGTAGLERRVVSSFSDLAHPASSGIFQNALTAEGVQTVYAAPLIVKGNLIGTITVFFRSVFHATEDWVAFLEMIAGQTAIAIDSAKQFADLQHANTELVMAYDTTIEGWSNALDLRDKETEGHTQRVTDMTLRLASSAGISGTQMIHIRRGALLHDIGKMGIPDSILLKPDRLTDEEWTIMRKHPVYAHNLLSPITYLRDALDIPYCHHEKWDGTGYPRGLSGTQIPLAARLFAVVDIWDALRSDRPYRPAWEEEQVKHYLHELSANHLDPEAVRLFFETLHSMN